MSRKAGSAAARPSISPRQNNPNVLPPFTRCDWSCRHSRRPSPNPKPWRTGTEVYGDRDILPRDPALRDERIFFIHYALRAGFSIEEIFNRTKIDRWFLLQIKEIVDFEEELAATAV